ncbi:YveK family protein [Ureibacillus endophyticus]|uniref:Capsular biosynthesis protein n=1 Tax=Ureibacillus endophyticus TaxID=1978490 RepID=A0A494YZ47_9BACL|nr:Wzz/FepE/Etk N-terminal domain-containing protein [Lysinibacillus endophyticus]RKQ15433.1 capsular biosynthesis protein [Lysinibacillus endophyticus]
MEESISLIEILKIIQKRLFLILSLVFVCSVISAIISYYVLPPIYEAETQILVNQKNSGQEYGWSQLETDLQLIDTYNVIIRSPVILTKVIEKLNLDTTPESLARQINVSNADNSKVVNIRVEDESPLKSVEIANTVAEVFKEEIPSLMNVDNISILSVAKLSENPSPVKPNKLINVAIAAIIGLMLGVGLAFLLAFLDTTIKTEQDIEEILALPIMGIVKSISEKDLEIPLPSRTGSVKTSMKN